MKFSLILLAFCLALSLDAGFARDRRDVVFLKNGSIIKGQIVEIIPDSLVKIETADGSMFVFKMSEVEKITKENIAPAVPASEDSAASTEESGAVRHFALTGGASFPLGDLASSSSGLAKTGYTIGGEYEVRFGDIVGWITQFDFSYNPVDEDAMRAQLGISNYPSVGLSTKGWFLYVPSTGIRVTGTLSPGASVFVAGTVGIAFGNSPEFTLTGPGGSVSQASANSSAFVFTVSGGFTIGDSFRLGVKYLSSTLKYDVSMSGVVGGENTSGSGNLEQQTSVLLLEAGVVF